MSERWVHRIEQERPSLRLFGFPYVGGSTSMFEHWQDDLAHLAEVCAVELPGRNTRYGEPLATDVPLLIERIGRGLAPLLDVPYVLFGHSFGALLAFEVAIELRRQGLPAPGALLVSAAHAPQRHRVHRQLSELPDDRLIAEIAAFGGTPSSVIEAPEVMSLYVPVIRADFRLVESYTFEPARADEAGRTIPTEVPLFLYGARYDRQVVRDDLLAWRELFSDVRSIELFDGGHFFCHERRTELTATIRRDLAALVRADTS